MPQNCFKLLFLVSLLALLVPLAQARLTSLTCPKNCQCRVLTDDTVESDCQRQGLTSIPRDLSNRTSRLLLQGNKIVSLPDGAFGSNLKQLTELYLNGNGLSLLYNESLRGLVSLRRLYLTQNKLTAFPQVCQFSTKLQRLNMDDNAIQDEAFPDSYSLCSQLTTISLNKNHWTSLSRSVFASLKNSKDLSSLKLSSVKLQYVENSTLADLSSTLRSLDLSTNALKEENLVELFQSTKFSKRFNSLSLRASAGLTRLPIGLLPPGHFPRLSHLDLTGCPGLTRIEDGALAGVGSYITDLLLDGSSIAQLSARSLAGLEVLRRLSLATTTLTGWSDPMPIQLAQLDVSSSRLTTIGGADGAVNPLPSLVQFDGSFDWLKAAGNPFRCDCDLAWLRLALQDSRVRARIPDLTRWLCVEPQHLAGQPVVNFTLPDDCSGRTELSVGTTSFSSPVSQSDSSSATTSFSTPVSQSDSSSATTSFSSPDGQSKWILPASCAGAAVVAIGLFLLIVFVARRRCYCRLVQLKSRGNSASSQATLDSEMIET